MQTRPPLQHDLKREVDLYATGCNVHALRSAWGNYLMIWEHTPEVCTVSQLKRVEAYESAVRVAVLKCKQVKNVYAHGTRRMVAKSATTIGVNSI